MMNLYRGRCWLRSICAILTFPFLAGDPGSEPGDGLPAGANRDSLKRQEPVCSYYGASYGASFASLVCVVKRSMSAFTSLSTR